MNKEHIIGEIRRTAKANRGLPLGFRRFEAETGIRYHDWYGQYWTRWGDAVREAGLEPNRMIEAFDDDFLLEKLVVLTRHLQRVPIAGDLLLAAKNDEAFPSEKVFRRFGSKPERVKRVIAYCEAHPGNEDVASFWRQIVVPEEQEEPEGDGAVSPTVGYVYILKHGSRREYKIGKTYNPLRREGELAIQLPEKLQPIHYIETDDPAGIENYWHTRFASKRKEGEWFALSPKDVRAFKRWKRIY